MRFSISLSHSHPQFVAECFYLSFVITGHCALDRNYWMSIHWNEEEDEETVLKSKNRKNKCVDWNLYQRLGADHI